MTISMQQWQANLEKEAFKRGDHIPHAWQVIFDDGMDGCMQKGFYAMGMQENGVLCDFPIMHEYGAFDSEKEAWEYVESVKEKLALNKEESKESHGPSGPNVDKQYAWPDDVEDDCYHMEEIH